MHRRLRRDSRRGVPREGHRTASPARGWSPPDGACAAGCAGSRTSGHSGTPVCAAVGGPVSAASLKRTLRGWTAPALRWAARRCSGPPSARQRARTDTAPCLTSSPPKGLKKEGTGTAALCPCHWFLPPPFPLVRGLRQSLRSCMYAVVPLLLVPCGDAGAPLRTPSSWEVALPPRAGLLGLPLTLCGLSSLLARLRNVLPQGSCVKVRPRCAH